MKALVLLLALTLSAAAAAQEPVRKKAPAKKKQATEQPRKQLARTKPTPEQIRKFNELAKKQKKD